MKVGDGKPSGRGKSALTAEPAVIPTRVGVAALATTAAAVAVDGCGTVVRGPELEK